MSGLLLVMFGFVGTLSSGTKAKAVSSARATTATATVGSPASALVFGPSTIADFQRVEGEPLNYIDKDGHYWISGPFGTTAQQSWIQRSTDNGDQFNLVSTTGLRPDAPPGGGDTDLTTDDQGNAYFIDLEALTNLGCSVSNDNGSTWRKNPECMQVPGVDRQWFATDNGSNHTIGAAGAADNTIFAQTNNQAVGSRHLFLARLDRADRCRRRIRLYQRDKRTDRRCARRIRSNKIRSGESQSLHAR